MQSFGYTSHQQRIVFGAGTLDQVRAEVERLDGKRPFVVTGPRGAAVVAALAPLTPTTFDGAAMHTPVEVTEQALHLLREADADCIVAVGGGSAIGLAKALALRTDLPQVVLPTTYSGSEATSLLGETANGRKVTHRSRAMLPKTVIYDVALTIGLPVDRTVTSAINALAHAVEALYAPDANPVTDRLAYDAIAGIASSLPRVVAAPATNVAARADLLQAAWLAGTCLGTVTMGLHHKLCHTLGGSFGLPHAETHTVLLPHVMAYNAQAIPEVFDRIADALGVADAPTGVYDLITALGGPTSLRDLGLPAADLARAAEMAVTEPYPNPRDLSEPGILALLTEAWHGHCPTASRTSAARQLTAQVVASLAGTPDPRSKHLLTGLVQHLHHFVVEHDVTEPEWHQAIEFLTRTGQKCDDTRQEFILLSDTLGVSSMVDLMTNSRATDTTPSAVLGPFYVDGPPSRTQGFDIAGGLPGTPLWVDVAVTGQRDLPVPQAVVDVWQSNKDGFYDVQLPEADGPVLRARFRTDDEGHLKFWTILPSAYPIPADGPVGDLLSVLRRHPYRAPHIHFMISAPGHTRLITQLFVAGGEYLDSDAVFGVKPELIVDFPERDGPTPDGRQINGGWHSLAYTFRIA